MLVTLSYSKAAAKPKAADLVTDGQRIDLSQEKYRLLFKELKEKHNFNQDELNSLFKDLRINKKVLELHDRQWEAKPYYQYWPLFITPSVIAKGKNKLAKYKHILDRVEEKYGVDRAVILAIWGIETRYGSNTGSYEVFSTLNTLFDAYPRRSTFFRKELVHFLILCRDNKIDTRQVKGSYAGAFGQAQFMPSSFREYAVSFDDNPNRDHFSSVEDVLASIANYLHRYRWTLDAPIYKDIGPELKSQQLISAHLKGRRKGLVDHQYVSKVQGISLPPVPGKGKVAIIGMEKSPKNGGGMRFIAAYPNFGVITRYNNSNRYAMAVTELAEAFTK